MVSRKKILALCGSTRAQSSNLHLLQAIGELYRDRLEITLFAELAQLPHFNPDLDTDVPPAGITAFRRQVKEAEGILICTPEYAMGVPGTLKNALDWTVSSMEFSHKPTALITASSQGYKGHASLLGTLRIIEADMPDESQLVIPFVKTKIRGNEITDAGTLERVQSVLSALMGTMDVAEQNKALESTG